MTQSLQPTANPTPEELERLRRRNAEIEAENERLLNLYVASSQLHATLELDEVLHTVAEVLINLVGAERFAIYLLDAKTRLLEAVAGDRADLSVYPRVLLGEGLVGGAVADGEMRYGRPDRDPREPAVCIPLCVRERRLGAIVIARFLEHKGELRPLDEELFALLASHAATAILAARLYGESERKLHTVQGLLTLLTQ